MSVFKNVKLYAMIVAIVADMAAEESAATIYLLPMVCMMMRNEFRLTPRRVFRAIYQRFPALRLRASYFSSLSTKLRRDMVSLYLYGHYYGVPLLVSSGSVELHLRSQPPLHRHTPALCLGIRLVKRTKYIVGQIRAFLFHGILDNIAVLGGFSSFQNRVGFIRILKHIIDNHVEFFATPNLHRARGLLRFFHTSFGLENISRIPICTANSRFWDNYYETGDQNTPRDPDIPNRIDGVRMSVSRWDIKVYNASAPDNQQIVLNKVART